MSDPKHAFKIFSLFKGLDADEEMSMNLNAGIVGVACLQ